jgi:hypothetical protein
MSSGENNDWEDCNTEIYNTWWQNRPIKGTSFKLPVALRATESHERYNIGVNVVFIDNETGRDVAHGGHSWAEFKVGDVTPLTDEKIIFTGSVNAEEGATIPTNLKVAIMSETCTFNEETYFHDCNRTVIGTPEATTGGDYNISVNVTDIQSAMGNQSHIMLIAFEDKVVDGVADGEFTDWDPTPGADNTNAEMAFWPYNSHFWFENWGDFRVGTSICEDSTDGTGECTYESETVTPGSDFTVDGIDFQIWNYNYAPEQSDAAASTEAQ